MLLTRLPCVLVLALAVMPPAMGCLSSPFRSSSKDPGEKLAAMHQDEQDHRSVPDALARERHRQNEQVLNHSRPQAEMESASSARVNQLQPKVEKVALGSLNSVTDVMESDAAIAETASPVAAADTSTRQTATSDAPSTTDANSTASATGTKSTDETSLAASSDHSALNTAGDGSDAAGDESSSIAGSFAIVRLGRHGWCAAIADGNAACSGGDESVNGDGSPLQIHNGRLCRAIHSAGVVEEVPGNRLRSGELTLLYCELTNYHQTTETREGEEVFVTRLQGGAVIRNSDGEVIQRFRFSPVEDISEETRTEFFLHLRLPLPELPAGDYQIDLAVEDLQSGQLAELQPPIRLHIH